MPNICGLKGVPAATSANGPLPFCVDHHLSAEPDAVLLEVKRSHWPDFFIKPPALTAFFVLLSSTSLALAKLKKTVANAQVSGV